MRKLQLLLLIFFIFITCFFTGCENNIIPESKIELDQLIENKQIWVYLDDYSILNDVSSWKYTFENIDVIIFNINNIKNIKTEDIQKINDIIKESNVKIAVECSGLVSVFGTDTFHNAEKSMAYNSVNHKQKGEYSKLSLLIENGFDIDFLIFKNSLTNAIYPNADHKTLDNRFMSKSEAIAQIVEAMLLWREHLPNVQFLYHTDFYNYGWKGETAYNLVYGNELGEGDFFYELLLLSETAKEAHLPLWGLIVNNPYDYVMGRHIGDIETTEMTSSINWISRLNDLQTECNQQDINFILTLTCDLTGRNGSDEKYYNNLIRFKNKYNESGGDPEVYAIKNGISYPSSVIPETKLFTLTYDVSMFIEHIKFGKELVLSDLSSQKPVDIPENIELIRKWNFDHDSEGWTKVSNLSRFKAENGYLSVVSDGGDPHFISNDSLNIDTADCDYLYLKYINISSLSESMEFFFSTNESIGMDEIKTIKFTVDSISEDEIWSELYLPLKQCDAWSGILKQMRLDPGMTNGEFRFDRIALYKQN